MNQRDCLIIDFSAFDKAIENIKSTSDNLETMNYIQII